MRQIRAIELSSGGLRLTHLREPQVRVSERRAPRCYLDHRGTGQIRARQVRVGERCLSQIGVLQVGRAHVRAREVDLDQAKTAKIGAAQIGAGEVVAVLGQFRGC
jgi:hypothetical protein